MKSGHSKCSSAGYSRRVCLAILLVAALASSTQPMAHGGAMGTFVNGGSIGMSGQAYRQTKDLSLGPTLGYHYGLITVFSLFLSGAATFRMPEKDLDLRAGIDIHFIFIGIQAGYYGAVFSNQEQRNGFYVGFGSALPLETDMFLFKSTAVYFGLGARFDSSGAVNSYYLTLSTGF